MSAPHHLVLVGSDRHQPRGHLIHLGVHSQQLVGGNGQATLVGKGLDGLPAPRSAGLDLIARIG